MGWPPDVKERVEIKADLNDSDCIQEWFNATLIFDESGGYYLRFVGRDKDVLIDLSEYRMDTLSELFRRGAERFPRKAWAEEWTPGLER